METAVTHARKTPFARVALVTVVRTLAPGHYIARPVHGPCVGIGATPDAARSDLVRQIARRRRR